MKCTKTIIHKIVRVVVDLTYACVMNSGNFSDVCNRYSSLLHYLVCSAHSWVGVIIKLLFMHHAFSSATVLFPLGRDTTDVEGCYVFGPFGC